MSPLLDLLSLDTYSLHKIVEKMSTNASTNFFRCSRGTEKLMYRIKPSWKLEKASIHYYGGSHRLLGKDGKVLSCSILKPTCSLKFVKIPHVSVSKCEDVFFNNVVLPELRAMTPVESLYLSVHERDSMNKVINAAQPKEVRLSDYYINPMDAVFHNVPSLSIQVHMDNAESYWKTPKLIELSKIHKKIGLACNHFYSQLVTVFLKNWFNGEQYNNFELSISLIARTAFKQHSFAEQLESVLVREDVQLLMKKCVKNLEGNFEVCGRNGQKMFIVTAGDHSLMQHEAEQAIFYRTAKELTHLSSSYIAPLFEEELVEEIENLDLEDQTTVLEAFREQWKQEIAKPVKAEEVKEEEAKALFLQGVECEKRGEMSEAVHKYTRAMKLVPDIERKVHPQPVPRARSTSRVRRSKKGQQEETPNHESNLIHTFEDRIAERGYRFIGTPEGSKCALNHLPTEILSLIIKYAVGEQINVRLLESLSEVSSGMYLLARNNELWRQIHIRSLGCSEAPVREPEISWRDVYLSYPHLHFEGVYLSKITYIRHGEPGFQDINYRPWHTVVYFRLIRFFPDGSVLMTTSSDNPQSSVNLLKSRGRADPAICFGTWYQEDADIIIQVRREYPPPQKPKNLRQTKRVPQQEYGILKHAFRIVLRLIPMRVQGKWSLQWIQNHCTVTYLDGSMTTSDLEAEKNSQEFPPLRFYRVKSYAESSCSKF